MFRLPRPHGRNEPIPDLEAVVLEADFDSREVN